MSQERIKALKTEIATISNQATTLYAQMESDEAARTTDNRTKFDNMIKDGEKKQAEVIKLEKLEGLKAMSGQGTGTGQPKVAGKDGGDPTVEDEGPAQGKTFKSWGARVIESDQYKAARAAWSEGKMARVKVGDAKAVTSTPASGGYLYRPQRETEIIDAARQRPFSLLDIVNVQGTEVESIEYIELSSRTNNADVVPEQDAGRVHVTAGAGITTEMIAADNGNYQENFAMKPKGNITFELKNAIVKTVAEWIAATRQVLADAPRLRGIIDNELVYMLRVKLEDMIVSANMTGFVGLLYAPNVATRVHKTSGRGWTAADTVADTLRRMQTDIQLSFYEMDAYVISPQVAEALELEKANTAGTYFNVFDPVTQRVWRKRVVVSNALNGANAGTAIAGNFAIGATLWDREDVQIRVGEPGNFFLENAVAILGELRAAFAVVRALAFAKATGLPV